MDSSTRELIVDAVRYSTSTDQGYVTNDPYALEYAFRNDIHNMRSSTTTDKEKRIFERCLSLTKAKSVKQMFAVIYTKWQAIIGV